MLEDARDEDGARELRVALHLADRAVRQWAAEAASHGRPGHRSAYHRLELVRPELGGELQRAAGAEQSGGLDAERELIAQMVWGIGERLAGIDPQAPPMSQQPALNQMSAEAAEILLAAGRLAGGQERVVQEANEALRELERVR